MSGTGQTGSERETAGGAEGSRGSGHGLPHSRMAEAGFLCAGVQLYVWISLLGITRGYALVFFTREAFFWVSTAIVFAVNARAVFTFRRFRNDAEAIWGLVMSTPPLMFTVIAIVLRTAPA